MAHSLFHRTQFLALATCVFFVHTSFAAQNDPALNSAAVLLYQHVGDERYPSTNVTLKQFESHLAYLEKHDFAIWPLEQVVAQIRSGNPFPEKVVAFTFDDAYRSTFLHALPLLKRRHWPYTLFVWTDAIDKHYPAFMNWNELRAAQADGASIGNHSASHAHLLARRKGEASDVSLIRAKNDIEKAQTRLSTELGKAPTLFAYPYGEFDPNLTKIITELGMVGFGEHSGSVGLQSDLRALPRFPISDGHASVDDLALRVNSKAMPIDSAQPWSPVHARNEIPTLALSLAENLPQALKIRCFGPADTPLSVSWKDKTYRDFEVAPPIKSAADGRTRVNCTVPAGKQTYYWFSRLWVEQYPRLPR